MESTEVTTGEERSLIYGLLAEVFRSPPTAESTRAVSEMAGALEMACPQGLILDELEREFMDLFVVPNPRYTAPYESAYRDRWPLPSGRRTASGEEAQPRVIGRLLMGDSTLLVRECFLEAGVLPSADLPDHFSNELRLLSHLWATEALEQGGGDGRLRALRGKVRDDHLLRWIGDLRKEVLVHDRLGFYSAALHLAEVVLQNDEKCGA